MKLSTIHPLAVFGLVGLSIFMTFISLVDAHEDPSEAEERKLSVQFRIERQRYRDNYPFRLNMHPAPESTELLESYPEQIPTLINKLRQYGTDKWTASESDPTSCFLLGHPIETAARKTHISDLCLFIVSAGLE